MEDLHHLPGTSELLSQILAPFFGFPFISFFSSQLLSTRVDSLHLSCISPIFVSTIFNPIEVTQLQTFLFNSVESPFHWIMVSTFVVLSSSCHVQPTIHQAYWTVTCEPNVQAWVPRRICSTHTKSCDVTSSRHLPRARVSSTAACIVSPTAWWIKRRSHLNRETQAAQPCALFPATLAPFVVGRAKCVNSACFGNNAMTRDSVARLNTACPNGQDIGPCRARKTAT